MFMLKKKEFVRFYIRNTYRDKIEMFCLSKSIITYL